MAQEERLKITLDGDSRGLINATGQAETSISKLFKIMGVASLAGGAIMLAQKGFQTLEKGIQLFISTIKEGIGEAANAELQLTKLNTSLKSTGNFTQEVSDELVKYAESIQTVTAYEDDAVVATEAMLATFKLNKDEIKIATQATLDLAAATGQDLQSAAILMGKAMVGETGMLKRYGIMVDENKYAAEGWKAVIDEINVEFGGQALAQGQTYTGMLERMKNMTGDLKETIGNAFLPTLKTLMDRFTTGTDIVDEFGNVIGKTEAPFQRLKEWVEQAAEKIKDFLNTLMGVNWTPAITGLKDLGKALGVLIRGSSSFESADQKAQGFANTLGIIAETVADFIRAIDLTIGSIKLLGTTLDMVIIGPIEAWRKAHENFKLAMDGNTEAIQANAREGLGWGESLDTLRGIVAHMKETIKGYNDESQVTIDKAITLPGILGGVIQGFDKTGSAADSARQLVEGYNSSLNSVPNYINTIINTTYTSNGQPTSMPGITPAAGQGSYVKGVDTTKPSAHKVTKYKNVAGQSVPYTVTEWYQSGGMVGRNTWASDLNIPLIKGEAVLPAALVRAIKENRGSFAGVGAGGGSPIINVNVTGNYISDSADEDRLAEKVGNKIMKNLKLQGSYVG